MSQPPLQIKRYPNRRYYARHASKYVSLEDIEELIRQGRTVEIRDSQTGEDLTRAVLTQIIINRQPEKMMLFPSDMLHFILRSNDAMSEFLRDYFRHSLTYLEYLQRHSPAASSLVQPMHWVKAWLDGIAPRAAKNGEPGPAEAEQVPVEQVEEPAGETAAQLAERVKQLEQRIRQLEARGRESPP